MKKLLFLATILMVGTANITFAQLGNVVSYQKISDTQGNFTGILDDGDGIGYRIGNIGDLNNDGFMDLGVGAQADDDGGTDKGALWLLFLKADGTVDSYQKISDTQGNFNGALDNGDGFGSCSNNIGDFNGDNIEDIIVTAGYDGDGGSWHGAAYILFTDTVGMVQSYQKISDTQGNFTAPFSSQCLFGTGTANIGDLNNDGVDDLAIGMRRDADGGTNRGALFVLFMNQNATVSSYQKISDTQGNFIATLDNGDQFGTGIVSLGDLDGDGIVDIATGCMYDDDGGTDKGALYILFLNTNGTVKSYQKISDTQGNFGGSLDNDDKFGSDICNIGDVNSDGIIDIAVGSLNDDDGGTNRGAIYILHLDSNGTVKSFEKISDTQGGFTGGLDNSDRFGRGLTSLGDLNCGGKVDIAVGAANDDDGGNNRGAVWILFFDSLPSASAVLNGTILCNGDTNCSISVNVTGGAPPYTYDWSTGDTTPSISDLGVGTYYVTVSDSIGCVQDVDTIIITEPTQLLSSIIDTMMVICVGDTNGSATVSASGGTPPYAFLWSLGGTNSVATGLSAGTYSVTITDANGCTTEHSVTITAGNPLTTSITGDNILCEGESATLSAGSGWNYSWNTGETTQSITVSPDSNSTYTVTVWNSCDTTTASIQINVYATSFANAKMDTTISEGSFVQLIATGGTAYSWSPPNWLSCTDCPNPIANPQITTTYCVKVTENGKCPAEDCVTIIVEELICDDPFVPNVFSPNGDGNNDLVFVRGNNFAIEKFIIYDRWGEKVFETKDVSIGWDGKFRGKMMNPAVYVWYLEVLCVGKEEPDVYKGNITLVR